RGDKSTGGQSQTLEAVLTDERAGDIDAQVACGVDVDAVGPEFVGGDVNAGGCEEKPVEADIATFFGSAGEFEGAGSGGDIAQVHAGDVPLGFVFGAPAAGVA